MTNILVFNPSSPVENTKLQTIHALLQAYNGADQAKDTPENKNQKTNEKSEENRKNPTYGIELNHCRPNRWILHNYYW